MNEPAKGTKQKIIHVAICLIRAKGYDQVTVNDICDGAGISKNTFYYYFKSKEDVLATFKQLPREVLADNLADIIGAENHYEQYWLLMQPIIDFIESSGREIVRQILISNLTKNDSPMHRYPRGEEYLKLETKILQKGQAAGEIRNGSDPAQLVYITFNQIWGSALFWCTSTKNHCFADVARYFIEGALDVAPALRKSQQLF